MLVSKSVLVSVFCFLSRPAWRSYSPPVRINRTLEDLVGKHAWVKCEHYGQMCPPIYGPFSYSSNHHTNRIVSRSHSSK